MTKRYVAGFMFSPEKDRVALIQKTKPEWQKGLWNGIGGHIEPYEQEQKGRRGPGLAMVREFQEETGLLHVRWEMFAKLEWRLDRVDRELVGEVFFFRAFSKGVDQLQTTTEEKVQVFNVYDLPGVPTVPNLRWLIPMAIHTEVGQGMPYVINEAPHP